MQITAKKLRPYIKTITYLAVASACFGVFFFLKTYFYPTITGSQTIIGLQKNMTTETVNIKEFNNLVDSINKKNSETETTSPAADPFK